MIKIYSTTWCPSCITAKQLLDKLGYEYEEILQILRKHDFEIFEYNNKKNLFHLDSNSIPTKGDLLAISDTKNFVNRTNYTIM